MMRKLHGLLAPSAENMRPDWRIADVLGTWWRWVLARHPCARYALASPAVHTTAALTRLTRWYAWPYAAWPGGFLKQGRASTGNPKGHNWCTCAHALTAPGRPNFENMMYPYCPPHIARPKEVKRLLLIALPERCYLSVRRRCYGRCCRWLCRCAAARTCRPCCPHAAARKLWDAVLSLRWLRLLDFLLLLLVSLGKTRGNKADGNSAAARMRLAAVGVLHGAPPRLLLPASPPCITSLHHTASATMLPPFCRRWAHAVLCALLSALCPGAQEHAAGGGAAV